MVGLHQRQGGARPGSHDNIRAFSRDDRHTNFFVAVSTGQNVECERCCRMCRIKRLNEIPLHDSLLFRVSAALIPKRNRPVSPRRR